MTTTPTQHEAERLAQLLEKIYGPHWHVQDSAAEYLRRIPTLEAENAELKARLDAIEKSMRDGLEREARLMARCVELKDELEAQRAAICSGSAA